MKFIPDTDEQGTDSRIQHPKEHENFPQLFFFNSLQTINEYFFYFIIFLNAVRHYMNIIIILLQ